MNRRTFLVAVGTTATAGIAGCSGVLDGSDRPPAQRRYDRYIGGSYLRSSFRSYVMWDSIEVTVNGERTTLTPNEDVITIATAYFENIGEEPVSTPLFNVIELIAEGYEPYHASNAIGDVDVDAIQPPEQNTEETHPSEVDKRRPQPQLEPDEGVEYHLLFDTERPPNSDYLLKFKPSEFEAGINTAKPIFLTLD